MSIWPAGHLKHTAFHFILEYLCMNFRKYNSDRIRLLFYFYFSAHEVKLKLIMASVQTQTTISIPDKKVKMLISQNVEAKLREHSGPLFF